MKLLPRALALLYLVAMLPAGAAGAPHVESEDDYVARVARDIVLKMVTTAADNDLRATICPDANARQRTDPAVVRALDCDNYRTSEPAAAPRNLADGRSAADGDGRSAADAAQGVWTTKGRESCGKSYYTWTVASKIGMSEFVDQSGQIDIERTLEIGENAILTETLSSYHPPDGHHERIGTRWRYVFTDRNHVQVRNLRTGSVFNLTRCD